MSAPACATYCFVVGSCDYQLVIFWDAQTTPRLMGMPDSFKWRQAHDTHMPYKSEIVTLTEIPTQETVDGGCGPRGSCGRGGSRECKESGNRCFPAEDIHGSASKPEDLWCLSCSAEWTGLVHTAQKQAVIHRAGTWLSAVPLSHGNKPKSWMFAENCVQNNATLCPASNCFIHPKISRAFKPLLLVCSQFTLLIAMDFFIFFPV